LKRPTPGDSNEVKALMIRANNAERRLANAQNQLAAAEEKMAAMNQKTTAADSKWEARVKEYETRLRAAEEKVKRERQGFKERVLELENQIKCVSAGGGSNVVLIGPFVQVSSETRRTRAEAESPVG
jgi:predicted  nucleic acid-binding Zn-ribbon protein